MPGDRHHAPFGVLGAGSGRQAGGVGGRGGGWGDLNRRGAHPGHRDAEQPPGHRVDADRAPAMREAVGRVLADRGAGALGVVVVVVVAGLPACRAAARVPLLPHRGAALGEDLRRAVPRRVGEQPYQGGGLARLDQGQLELAKVHRALLHALARDVGAELFLRARWRDAVDDRERLAKLRVVADERVTGRRRAVARDALRTARYAQPVVVETAGLDQLRVDVADQAVGLLRVGLGGGGVAEHLGGAGQRTVFLDRSHVHHGVDA